jgi:hypothetical protein
VGARLTSFSLELIHHGSLLFGQQSGELFGHKGAVLAGLGPCRLCLASGLESLGNFRCAEGLDFVKRLAGEWANDQNLTHT